MARSKLLRVDRTDVQFNSERPKRADAAPDAGVIPPAARNLQPLVPVVAPDHGAAHPQSWPTIEVEMSSQAAATVFREAARQDLSKTQYLRSVLRRALDADMLGGSASLLALTWTF